MTRLAGFGILLNQEIYNNMDNVKAEWASLDFMRREWRIYFYWKKKKKKAGHQETHNGPRMPS